jgi:hypothetical protein
MEHLWDEFVRGSCNGHFLLERGYMDYHADRMEDASLMVFDGDRLLTLLPANRREDSLVSHDGLPFAGFVMGPRTLHQDMRSALKALSSYLLAHGFKRFVYRPTPVCYHRMPCQDDICLLHEMGAVCTKTKLSSGFAGPVPVLIGSETQRSVLKAARKLPCDFVECQDVALFWGHLERFLQARHGTRPVHTVEEMTLLRRRFPGQIRMFLAKAGEEIVGGVLVYLTARVMRMQYSFRHRQDSTSVSRRLTLWLAAHPECSRPWIDLGTSLDPETGEIDTTLLRSKERTGGRGTVVQTWTWEMGSHVLPPVVAAS